MHVLVQTIDCAFPVEIERMIRLFFETCQVSVNPETDFHSEIDADIRVVLHFVCGDEKLAATGTIACLKGISEAHHSIKVSLQADPATRRKRGKQVVLHVLHQLLQYATDQQQPWGILTGMRPTKLVHAMHEQGMHRDVIDQTLQKEYLISNNRTKLLLEIVQIQHQVVPDLYALDDEVSLYIGIPFCPTHCAYCTFPAYSMNEKATYVEAFLAAMDKELMHLGQLLREFQVPVTSVYLGGGTPTSLRAFELEHVLATLYREIPGYSEWREFTVEAGRPDTITPDRVTVMKEYGVNRISVNPQTFKAETLREIKRGHTPDMVDHRFHYVRDAGFDNINMDMILGLPGETLADVRYTRERIEHLNPDSVTIHTMSFKRSATVNVERDRFRIPDTCTVQKMMEETVAWVRKLGYHPYYLYRQKDILGNLENIGFAKRGKESVYNICIMEERQTIVGIGGGAVTKQIGFGGKSDGRFANPREPKAYIDTIDSVIEKKDKVLRHLFGQFRQRQRNPIYVEKSLNWIK